jgi:hypothetical protein
MPLYRIGANTYAVQRFFGSVSTGAVNTAGFNDNSFYTAPLTTAPQRWAMPWVMSTQLTEPLHDLSYTDTVGITDSVTKELTKGFADNVGITEAKTFARTVARTDTIGVLDPVAKDLNKAVVDTIGITKVTLQEVGALQEVSNSVGLTDVVTRDLNKGFANNVGLLDPVAKDRNEAYVDGLGITDPVAKALTKAFVDNVGITETTARARGKASPAVDVLGITDSVVKDLTKGFTNNVGVTDPIAKARTKEFADSVGIRREVLVAEVDALQIQGDVTHRCRYYGTQQGESSSTVSASPSPYQVVRGLRTAFTENISIIDADRSQLPRHRR